MLTFSVETMNKFIQKSEISPKKTINPISLHLIYRFLIHLEFEKIKSNLRNVIKEKFTVLSLIFDD